MAKSITSVNQVKPKSVMTNQQFLLVRNEMLTLTREALNRLTSSGAETDIDDACKYRLTLAVADYKKMYDRMGLARRVVEIWPDECWQLWPEIYEEEGPDLTDFEKAWNDLVIEHSLYSIMHRADILSGIGSYGVILLGLDDGLTMDKPVMGINPITGEVTKEISDRKLLYIRTFDESVLTVDEVEQDAKSPRYGKPKTYSIQYNEPVVKGISTLLKVHWTRIIHLADNRESSDTFGVSRLQAIYNNLFDIKKIAGGSGEMFWKGGFPGYAFELPVEAMEAGAELDIDSIKTQLKSYFDGLQRYIGLQGGVSAKSLLPQVADPTGHVEIQLKLVALSLGVPYRVLLGTEEAKLASVQDKRTWNGRVAKRQSTYLTPFLIRPFIDRLIALGILKRPTKYIIEWPDLNASTEDDIAKVALNRTDAFAKYVQGSVDALVPPREYLTIFHKMTEAEVQNILSASENYEREMDVPVDEIGQKPIPRTVNPAKTSP